MLIRQIVDATENGQMRADFVFRRKIHKAVIFDIEVRSAEIQFFPRIHPFCRKRGTQFLAPQV
jgi:hypothetical protein